MRTIMFTLLSRRLVVLPALCTLTLLILSKLASRGQIPTTHQLLEALARSQIQRGVPVQYEPSPWSSKNNSNPLLTIYKYDANPSSNPHIKSILKCDIPHNEHTHHIRLPGTPFLNISMSTTEQAIDPASRYFNPTLIPLPPWSSHPYLLVSRLATAGFHQESHICLASLCLPKNSHKRLPLDTKACTDDELQLLGPAGGLHCTIPPQKLNIPTTPTWRCETSWSMYPDIPGFHDPRIFWSGKGEPLAIINSGSQYGCVGLWVVDLRSIYNPLDEVMEKGRGDSRLVQSKMSYRYVTEITRNGQRDLIEKNWALFFPRGEEAWVMYDMFLHGEKKQGSRGVKGEGEMGMRGDGVEGTDDLEDRHGVGVDEVGPSVHNSNNNNNNESASDIKANLTYILDHHISLESQTSNNNLNPTSNDSSSNLTIASNASSHSNVTITTLPKRIESINPTPFDEFRHQKPHIHPSRSLAKLIGNGYTTPNLTSPYESPCFNTSHIHDVLGNIGHWHQGTNSLRLVLCRRPHAGSTESQKREECTLTDDNEEELVNSGRVVHVMVMHRKFSNEMKLPMMYERYFMVWEARWPFRVIGINKYPILFEDEMAKPWSVEENFSVDVDHQSGDERERERLKVQRERWRSVYFTYTPSLAWAWRGLTVASQDGGMGERGLGTGYLGDDVIVGIGVDDVAQVVVREKIERLLSCLRLCPDFE